MDNDRAQAPFPGRSMIQGDRQVPWGWEAFSNLPYSVFFFFVDEARIAHRINPHSRDSTTNGASIPTR